MSHQFNLSNSEDNFEEQPLNTERLQASAEEESMQLRLRIVDHLLSNAPMLAPGAEFAEKVMASLRQRTRQSMNSNTSLGLALGLGSIVLLLIGTIIGGILGVINIALNWSAIYQGLVSSMGEVIRALESFFSFLTSTISDEPLIPALLLLFIPLFLIWLWVMRRLKPAEKKA